MKTLKLLVERKIRDNSMSIRSAATELGVSHTTIHRVVNGEVIDLDTVIKICKWLGVRPSTILDVEVETQGTALNSIVAIVEQDPRLSDLFSELAKDLKDGTVELSDVEDIISYAAFRMRNAKPRNNQVHAQDRPSSSAIINSNC